MKTQQKISLIAVLATLALVISCKKDDVNTNAGNMQDTPTLPEKTDNYAASSNDKSATLGRVLFYDKKLSLNNSVSCSSCHQQSKAFCDNLKFSVGLENVETARNSPSIFSKSGRMFWDGRATNLSNLVLRPIKNHVEMKFENLTELAKKISEISYYPALFKKAYGTEKIDSTKIQAALFDFLLNFDFSNNKFNRSLAKKEALSATEEIGRTVFFGKGKCSNCHHIESRNFPMPNDTSFIVGGYGFTNQSFNIGLDLEYADNGLGAVSGFSSQDGQFMVPALLNVEYTAPYMHDGRFNTLEEVVEHYNSGIKEHRNLDFELRDLSEFENMTNDEIIRKFDTNHSGELEEFEIPKLPPVRLGLDENEKRCLVAFLKTLSDPSIFTDQRFSNPFAVK